MNWSDAIDVLTILGGILLCVLALVGLIACAVIAWGAVRGFRDGRRARSRRWFRYQGSRCKVSMCGRTLRPVTGGAGITDYLCIDGHAWRALDSDEVREAALHRWEMLDRPPAGGPAAATCSGGNRRTTAANASQVDRSSSRPSSGRPEERPA